MVDADDETNRTSWRPNPLAQPIAKHDLLEVEPYLPIELTSGDDSGPSTTLRAGRVDCPAPSSTIDPDSGRNQQSLRSPAARPARNPNTHVPDDRFDEPSR